MGRRLVVVLLVAGVLAGCSSGDDDPEGIENVYEKAGEIAQTTSREQQVACTVSGEQITVAVLAWRADTGDTAAQPTYEQLVAEGFIEAPAGDAWTITYAADGTPTAVPAPGGACEAVADP